MGGAGIDGLKIMLRPCRTASWVRNPPVGHSATPTAQKQPCMLSWLPQGTWSPLSPMVIHPLDTSLRRHSRPYCTAAAAFSQSTRSAVNSGVQARQSPAHDGPSGSTGQKQPGVLPRWDQKGWVAPSGMLTTMVIGQGSYGSFPASCCSLICAAACCCTAPSEYQPLRDTITLHTCLPFPLPAPSL